MKTIKQKQNETFVVLKEKLGWTNPMQAPRLLKAVISVGTGSLKDKKKNELVADRLTKITGQKPAPRGAKKAVAAFKTRLGDLIGYQITLRGPRLFGFLDKFLNVALPRTKDFRGISSKAIDEMGNITIGIREHTIFPETADEDLRDIFGMAITIVTSAKNRAEALAFFEHIGIPFRKK
ncbi:MAG: 50S ribosomal protein L5 [Candidatus Taylorbacteria bacterium RIFCSPHIGHO2_02_FULL_44_36]|uniref:Large ribosomal subunit protein uL5 n=1 Tax=Candidatus Taylorbacteria bacterium RIFCSPLOWO2_12_FULL_44_15c TaxID=1802333 RepID=A0A1G2P831_9BACT|nr:MAG: 50S ribosomal protein L5 [Candidatus Taylorbacteria bacterium RIFCSPHIGHO2_02_FULL_44_36]OHA38595.1 MAG: 50S ribosomal protein L5 [Candidatus Taylorbacteria bacterium RIFCSPLOWO2_02_FULL_44_35]OHA43879.1 MAG: 50S ribosomal protein L5 [Candidatus Taylorbacteria bacterium RIFCSPLOWO2_12_FULL_44_15c]